MSGARQRSRRQRAARADQRIAVAGEAALIEDRLRARLRHHIRSFARPEADRLAGEGRVLNVRIERQAAFAFAAGAFGEPARVRPVLEEMPLARVVERGRSPEGARRRQPGEVDQSLPLEQHERIAAAIGAHQISGAAQIAVHHREILDHLLGSRRVASVEIEIDAEIDGGVGGLAERSRLERRRRGNRAPLRSWSSAAGLPPSRNWRP